MATLKELRGFLESTACAVEIGVRKSRLEILNYCIYDFIQRHFKWWQECAPSHFTSLNPQL